MHLKYKKGYNMIFNFTIALKFCYVTQTLFEQGM